MLDSLDYLSPDAKRLHSKLIEIWNTPTEKEKMITYLKAQRFSETDAQVAFEIICNPNINEYRISKEIGNKAERGGKIKKASDSAIKKSIRKLASRIYIFSGLKIRGVSGMERPLLPSELMIRYLYDTYECYETTKIPPTPGKPPTSGLGYLKIDDKILLAKQKSHPSKGIWILPGGYHNPKKGDKNVRETVRRRMKEIAEVDVAVEEEIMVYEPLDVGMPTESHIYECRVVGGKLKEGKVEDDFASETKLWSFEEAITSPEVREREKKLIKHREMAKDREFLE